MLENEDIEKSLNDAYDRMIEMMKKAELAEKFTLQSTKL
jgi:hypothetical protein